MPGLHYNISRSLPPFPRSCSPCRSRSLSLPRALSFSLSLPLAPLHSSDRTWINTQTHAHAHARTRARARTHTHNLSVSLSLSLSLTHTHTHTHTSACTSSLTDPRPSGFVSSRAKPKRVDLARATLAHRAPLKSAGTQTSRSDHMKNFPNVISVPKVKCCRIGA